MKLALKNDSYYSVPEGEINVSVIVGEDKLGLEFGSVTTSGIRVQLDDGGPVNVGTVRLGFYGLAAKEALASLIECTKALYINKRPK